MKSQKKSPKIIQPKKKKKLSNASTGENTGDVNKGTSVKRAGGVQTGEQVNKNFTPTLGTFTPVCQMASQQNQYAMAPPPGQPMPFQGSMQPPLQALPQQPQQPMVFQYSPSQQPNPQMNFNFKPDSVTEILDNMKEMKKELSKLSSIEKNIGTLTIKMNTLDTKVSSMEAVVNNCEKSCTFLSATYETQSKDISEAKKTVSNLKKQCDDLDKQVKEQTKSKKKLESKVIDLEARSMRENLLFNGIPESESENCEVKVKDFMIKELELETQTVNDMTLDRVHRIGRAKGPGTIRPIVAKFHKYADREKVREIGYNKKNNLTARKLSVKRQLPNDVVQKRKTLSAVFEKAKVEGKNPKFVMEKLYIDGEEYVPPSTPTGTT